MRSMFLLCGLALFSLSGIAYTAKAQEDPGFNFPPYNAPPQAKIEFYENEIKKCKVYLDELSIGINKATILFDNIKGQYPFAGYNWSDQLHRFEREVEIVCHKIELHKEGIQKQIAQLPPSPSPTPTPSPRPPATETKSDQSSDALKSKQLREFNDEIKFISEYTQKVKQVSTDADKLYRAIEDAAKKANPNSSAASFKAETTSSGGFSTITFTNPQGRLFVYLPDDIAAGDNVSGTVVSEPNGQTEEERARNRNALNRYQLMIANQEDHRAVGNIHLASDHALGRGHPRTGHPREEKGKGNVCHANNSR